MTTPATTPWRRRLLVTALAPVVSFLALEAALAWADVCPTHDPVEVEHRDDGTVAISIEGGDGLRIHTALPVDRPADATRTVVIGDSTAYGMFLTPTSTIARFLEADLSDLLDGRHEVLTLAAPAIRTARSRRLVDVALAHLAPDTIVVYAGHNELLQPYLQPELERVERPMTAGMESLLARCRVGRWLLSTRPAPSLRLDATRPDVLPRSRTAAARATLHDRFEEDLRAIAAACAGAGVTLVLPTPVSNAREHGPFVSAHTRALDEAARRTYARQLQRARRHIGRGELDDAACELALAGRLDPDVAERLWLLSQLAWARNDVAAARSLGRRAWGLDEDGRAASAEIHARHRAVVHATGAVAVDLTPSMEVASDPSRPLFMDYAHPTVRGQWVIGREIARALAARTAPHAGAAHVSEPLPSFERRCEQLAIPSSLVHMSDATRLVGPVLSALLADEPDAPVRTLREVLAELGPVAFDHPLLVGADLVLALHDGDHPRAQDRIASLRALDGRAAQRLLSALQRSRSFGPALDAAGLDDAVSAAPSRRAPPQHAAAAHVATPRP